MPGSASESLPDAIHRSVHVTAARDAVWSLVSRPEEWMVDSRQVVLVDSLEPDFIALRSTAHHGGDPSLPETRIEVFCSDSTDGTVRVRVVESGFAAASGAEEATRAHAVRTMAWEDALDRLRRRLA